MPNPRFARPETYDPRTIWLHWLTVALVATQWLGAHAIDWFPRGALRTDARSLHIVVGAIFLSLIFGRLAWRWTWGRQLPSPEHGVLKAAAMGVHGLLYILLLSTMALGLMNAWFRGDSLFGLVSIPKLAPANKDLMGQVEHLHALAANAILVVAAFHAAAAIWHQYWRRDGVLRRMIPGLST